MHVNTIFERLLLAGSRLRTELNSFYDCGLALLIFGYFVMLSIRLSWQSDGIRKSLLQKRWWPGGIAEKPWSEIYLLMQRIVVFVPWGRNHRCLIVMVLIGDLIRYLQPATPVEFHLGKIPTQNKFHAWLTINHDNRLDLDSSPNVSPNVSNVCQPLFSMSVNPC